MKENSIFIPKLFLVFCLRKKKRAPQQCQFLVAFLRIPESSLVKVLQFKILITFFIFSPYQNWICFYTRKNSQAAKTVNLTKIPAWVVMQTGNSFTAVQREALDFKTHCTTFPIYKTLENEFGLPRKWRKIKK